MSKADKNYIINGLRKISRGKEIILKIRAEKNIKKDVDKGKWVWYYNTAPCEKVREKMIFENWTEIKQRTSIQIKKDKNWQRSKCHKEQSNGEFDPGSGWTLAACLIHASRTKMSSDILVANGWVIRKQPAHKDRDNCWKR